MYQTHLVAFVTEVLQEMAFRLATRPVFMTVVSMEFAVRISYVTVILAGLVKTAVLIVAVMDTVIARKGLAFVTSVKITHMEAIVSSVYLAHSVMQLLLRGANLASVMTMVIQPRIGVTIQQESVSVQTSPWEITVIHACLVL